MPDNNKLELVVEVDVNKATASIKSLNILPVQHGAGRGEGRAGRFCRDRRTHISIGGPDGRRASLLPT